MTQFLGWIGTVIVLAGYAVSTWRHRPVVFHWANVVGALILVPVNLVSGVPFAAVLSGSFGVIAAVGLVKDRRRRPKHDTTPYRYAYGSVKISGPSRDGYVEIACPICHTPSGPFSDPRPVMPGQWLGNYNCGCCNSSIPLILVLPERS